MLFFVQIVFSSLTGRGNNTHAYTHSVFEGHHVFLNLQTQKFYCLPDNYQIIDSSLDDIIVSSESVIKPWSQRVTVLFMY